MSTEWTGPVSWSTRYDAQRGAQVLEAQCAVMIGDVEHLVTTEPAVIDLPLDFDPMDGRPLNADIEAMMRRSLGGAIARLAHTQ